MKLKKANAIMGLFSIALLLAHAIYIIITLPLHTVQLQMIQILGWACAIVVAIHAILGMCIVMFAHDGSNLKQYPKANLRTILQRASAIGIMVLVVVHLVAGTIIRTGAAGAVSAAVLQFLFFTCVFVHIATSFSNAFVTLGWLSNMETKKRIDLAVWIFCGIVWAAAVFVVVKNLINLAVMLG